MKPAPFDYHAPRSIAEATELLANLENAKVISGGQSMVPMMNYRYLQPEHLVDISRIGELSGIAEQHDTIVIGGVTTQREIEFSSFVGASSPIFHAALAHVGHRQTRNRGTIGGSLAHADPAAELPAVCALLDAEIEIASVRGRRTIPFSDFVKGFMETALEHDEILVAVRYKPWARNHGYGFQEYSRRHGDFAIVGAGVQLELDDNRRVKRVAIAICGATATAHRLQAAEDSLQGEEINDVMLAKIADIAGSIETLEDIHASGAYRRHLARVLVVRAIRQAASATMQTTQDLAK